MLANAIIRFLKDWTLPVAMIAGTLAYFLLQECRCLLRSNLWSMPW